MSARLTLLEIRRSLVIGMLGLLWWCAATLPLQAHMQAFPMATATVQADGTYSFDLTFDVLAFALDDLPSNELDDPMNALLDGPEAVLETRLNEAQARFKGEFAVLDNGKQGTVDSLIFPSLADIRRHKEASPFSRLPVMLGLSLKGRLVAGASSLSFRLPSKLEMISLKIVRPDQTLGVVMVDPGVATEPMPVKLDTVAAEQAIEVISSPGNQPAIVEPSRWHWVKRYIELGFVHIVPRGMDHILFVLGLFLLGSQLRPLLLQITAFTLAHSITLALAMYGIFSLPPRVVEPLIALSIAFVALENIFTSKLHKWRLFLVFGFGLIHGLGFASVLTSLGLPKREFVTALVSFNVGVECGQLSVIGLGMLAAGWCRNRSWYRRRIVIPASGVIAAIGVFWAVQRIIFYSR